MIRKKSAMNHPVANKFRLYRKLKYFDDNESDVLNPAQRAFIQRVESAVSSLPEQEREIITKRFMDISGDYIYDYEVYDAMQISQPLYTKMRDRAFNKLAIVLNIDQL